MCHSIMTYKDTHNINDENNRTKYYRPINISIIITITITIIIVHTLLSLLLSRQGCAHTCQHSRLWHSNARFSSFLLLFFYVILHFVLKPFFFFLPYFHNSLCLFLSFVHKWHVGQNTVIKTTKDAFPRLPPIHVHHIQTHPSSLPRFPFVTAKKKQNLKKQKKIKKGSFNDNTQRQEKYHIQTVPRAPKLTKILAVW